MSFRVRYSLPVWVAASLLIGSASARDLFYHGPAHLEPLHHDNDHEIIFEMEPLHPVKRSAAQPAKSTLKQAEQSSEQSRKSEPTRSAKGVTTNMPAAPAPVEAAKAQPEAPKADAAAVADEAVKPADAGAPGAGKPIDAAAPSDAGRVAATPPAVPTNPVKTLPAPESAASPDTLQPAPTLSDQASNPSANIRQEKPAAQPAPVASDKPADEVDATVDNRADAAPAASQTDNRQVEASAPAAPGQPVPVDSAARVASLLALGVNGPMEVRIDDRATMFLPAGRTFIADDAARELAKIAGFDWRNAMRGLIAPTGDKLEWLAPVEVLEDGFVKSDVPLDADKLLVAFNAGLPDVNARRVKAGQPAVELSGWLTAPALDDRRRLSACVNVATQGGDDKYFNCEAWALGRDGAIKISLADGGENSERLKGEARALAETIVYDHGKTYDATDPGADKVAPYTVGDLLTSDVSANSLPAADEGADEGPVGLLTLALKTWKPIAVVVAFLGVAGWLRRKVSGAAPDTPRKGETPAAPDSSTLFAKLLPSLYARFGARRREASQSASPDVKSNAPAPFEETGGLLGNLPGLRNRSARDAGEPAASAPMDETEAASTLQRLASRMRRGEREETSPGKVDVSRALRPMRSLPGAAPETVAPPAAVSAPSTPASSTASPKAGTPAPESARSLTKPDASFGLVEPGDPEATSAAREALRQSA